MPGIWSFAVETREVIPHSSTKAQLHVSNGDYTGAVRISHPTLCQGSAIPSLHTWSHSGCFAREIRSRAALNEPFQHTPAQRWEPGPPAALAPDRPWGAPPAQGLPVPGWSTITPIGLSPSTGTGAAVQRAVPGFGCFSPFAILCNTGRFARACSQVFSSLDETPAKTGTRGVVGSDVMELCTEQRWRETLNIYMFIIITIYITPKSSPTAMF